MPRSIPGLSIDTKTLSDRLARAEVDEIVTYQELTSLIGRDVQSIARGNLNSAVRRMLADGRVFACVHGVGVKRLNDHEIVGVGTQVLSKVRRTTNRARVKLAAVQDFDALPRDEKATHNMAMSVLGVLSHMTKPSTVRQLETRIDEARTALPLQKTLDALSKV